MGVRASVAVEVGAVESVVPSGPPGAPVAVPVASSLLPLLVLSTFADVDRCGSPAAVSEFLPIVGMLRESVVEEVPAAGGTEIELLADGVAGGGAAAVAPASTKPGVKGCVSSLLRSASTQRICMTGPYVTGALVTAVARTKPQNPPRKSVVSPVQVMPLGTHHAAVSPVAMGGNPSPALVCVEMIQFGPTLNPSGQMAGE